MSGDNYITVMGWMVRDLGLRGNELLVYALIHGFSQNGEGMYYGSIQDTCEWIGCTSRHTVINVLSRLTERGLLRKLDIVIDGISRCAYMVQKMHQCKNCTGAENAPGVVQKMHQYQCKNCTDTSNIKDNNKDIYKKETITIDSDRKEKTDKAATIERLTEEFRESLAPYAGKYTRQMLDAFAGYWTEPYRNPVGNRYLRWQGEKTWSLEGRLRTWADRDRQRSRSYTPGQARAYTPMPGIPLATDAIYDRLEAEEEAKRLGRCVSINGKEVKGC